MSRKLVRAAWSVAALAAGLFVVGCGATASTGAASDAAKKAADAAKEGAKEGMEKAKEVGKKLDDAKEKATDVLDAGVKKAKDELEKELGPIEAKLGELKKTVDTEKDPVKVKAANDMYQPAVGKLDEIKKMIADNFTIAKAKELLTGDTMKKLVEQITAKIADLKKQLGL